MQTRESSITALQYTPGAGTPSAVAKLRLLRKVHEDPGPDLKRMVAGAVLDAAGRPIWCEL